MEIIKRVDHVVTLVRDLDSAFDTYTQRLGFPVSWARSGGAEWHSAAVWLGNASMELLQPFPEAGPTGAFFAHALEAHGEGLFMIAFEPACIDISVAELQRRGVPVTGPTKGQPAVTRPEDARAFSTAFISGNSARGVNSLLCEYYPPFKPQDGGKGPLKIKKLDHVVIATNDLDDATRLWERNLGLKPDASLDHPLGAGFKVARLPIGDAFLELVQPVAKEGRFYEQVQERGEGLFSISVEVEDLDEAVAFLRSKGAKVSGPEPSIWPNARLARINQGSAHGVSIQLIERR